MNSIPGLWFRFKNRVRYGLAMQEILDRLARIGVVIYPYFVVDEPIAVRPEVDGLDEGLQIKLLQAHEAALIASVPERPRNVLKIRELMTRAICVAVMENAELLAYSWFSRQHLGAPASANVLSELPTDWAYLFDMYVRPKARGRNMAVYMRHRVHQILAEQGVRHCCSITLMFNRSSRRFKTKLGAIEVELRLLMRLKPFPGLDLRLRQKPWPLQTPFMHVAYPAPPRN